MAADAQIRSAPGPSRRRVPRFRMEAPLEITVLRSGIPDKVPGRAMNVCERGIGAVLAGELLPGESVGVEVQLSPETEPLRTRATVRYQEKLRCGLEFVAISAQQRSRIRDWTKEAKAETSGTSMPIAKSERKDVEVVKPVAEGTVGPQRTYGKKRRRVGWLVVIPVLAIGLGVFWWKWNRGWEELESGLDRSAAVSAEKPAVQVPAEVMQKLLVHRVEPVYPADARKQNLQGIIAVTIVVGRDGSVRNMRALNGPDVLGRAAMDALRWWKFEPYRVNGEAVVAETTVAVEFKR